MYGMLICGFLLCYGEIGFVIIHGFVLWTGLPNITMFDAASGVSRGSSSAEMQSMERISV